MHSFISFHGISIVSKKLTQIIDVIYGWPLKKRILLEAKYPNVCQLATKTNEKSHQLLKIIDQYIRENAVIINLKIGQ